MDVRSCQQKQNIYELRFSCFVYESAVLEQCGGCAHINSPSMWQSRWKKKPGGRIIVASLLLL